MATSAVMAHGAARPVEVGDFVFYGVQAACAACVYLWEGRCAFLTMQVSLRRDADSYC
jgi:hypothetical protein